MIRQTFELEEYYRSLYLPDKLVEGSPSDAQMQLTIERLREFAAERFSIAPLTIDCVDDCLLAAFKGWRSKWRGRQVSPATVNKDLRNIRAIINHAVQLNQAPRPLRINFFRVAEDEPEAWSIDEFRRLLAACREEPGQICGIRAADWWTAQQLTILNTGARISAVMKTAADQFDPHTGALRIVGSVQKHKRGQAIVLHQTVADAIRKIYGPREMLFPWPFDAGVCQWPALTKRYRAILTRAGLPATSRDLFHKVRRTCGTYVTAAADEETAREQLGHSTVKVTKRYIDRTKLTKRLTATELLPWELLSPEAGDPQLRLF